MQANDQFSPATMAVLGAIMLTLGCLVLYSCWFVNPSVISVVIGLFFVGFTFSGLWLTVVSLSVIFGRIK